jgi:DNA invertase Pin-like site-specific DNA recombinase
MKAAIYSRKSRFTGKGDSIENQIQICTEHAKTLGISEFLVYEDEGFSGKNLERPKFQEMLLDAKNKKFNYLICYRLDRISRNVSDFSTLIEHLNKLNISFISVKEQFDTSTPMGRAMMYISSVFAQLERETIAERIKDNMYELARGGRWLGGIPPWGFDSKEIVYFDENMIQRKMYQLEINEEDMELVKKIYDLYLEKKSLTYVFRQLEISGIRGRRGGFIDRKTISGILKNPAYVMADEKIVKYLASIGLNVVGEINSKNGILVYGKNTQDTVAAVSKHKGVIDSDTWLYVQQIIDKNKDKAPRAGTGKREILSGLIKCSKCNTNMLLSYKNTGDKEPILYYACGKKKKLGAKHCNCKNVRVDVLEDKVINLIKAKNFETIVSEYEEIKEEYVKNFNEVDVKIKSLQSAIKEKEGLVDTLVMQLARISDSSASKFIVDKIEAINTEIIELNKQVEEFEGDITFPEVNIDEIVKNLNRFNAEVDFSSIERKRELLNNIVDSIIWNGDNDVATINYRGVSVAFDGVWVLEYHE